MSNVWSSIILEGYCVYSSMSKKQWKCHGVKSWEPLIFEEEATMHKNKNYISKSRRIKWCRVKNKKRIPCYRCLKSNCPFFAYTDVSRKEYFLFYKAMEKLKEGEK